MSTRFDSIREIIDNSRSLRGVSYKVSDDNDEKFIGQQESVKGDDIPNVLMTTKEKKIVI